MAAKPSGKAGSAEAKSPKPGAKRKSPARNSSDDDLHEDKTVKEILALAKSECSYTALIPLFEYSSRGNPPHASKQHLIHLRLSALEVLKPYLKELTISSGEKKNGIKEISTRKGLGKFLRSYSTDHTTYPLTSLIFHKMHVKFADLHTDLPKSVKKIEFRQCVINDVSYHVPWSGDHNGPVRILSRAERVEKEVFSLDTLSTDKSNFCPLARAMFKSMNKKYDEMNNDWDDYLKWLAHHVKENGETARKRVFELVKFWSMMLKNLEIKPPMPTADDGWYALLSQLDRIAVKDIANFVGGTFKRARAKSAKNCEPASKKVPPAAGAAPSGKAPPAAAAPKKK